MAVSMNELLGIKQRKKRNSRSLEKQYQECKQQVQQLFNKITAKIQSRDTSLLSKYNDHCVALNAYEASQQYEAKSMETQPVPAPEAIPAENRPKTTFPVKEPNSKGSAAFALRRRLKGHRDKIHALKWSKDSKSLVSASQDGTLIVWNMQNFTKKLAIPLRHSWTMSTDFSPNGKLVACGGLDNLCSIFDISDQTGWAEQMSQRPLRELQQHEGYVSCTRFVDNQHILTASGDGNCLLWDIEYQQPIVSFVGHTGDVESLAHNFGSNNTFVSGSLDLTAKVWDYRLSKTSAGGNCTHTFTGHHSDVNCVRWFPHYKSFGTASEDGCCRLFDVGSYQIINTYGDKLEECHSVTYMDFSKSGYYLAAAYDGPMCLAWNTVTAKLEKCMPHPKQPAALEFQPNGNSLATGCWDHELRIWA